MERSTKSKSQMNSRICVIGAGPSGITAIKNLQEQGFSNITVFEKNNQIGGNWIYDETESHSSIYETTHIISSKKWSQFDDFPMPADYPDYPSHAQMLRYFQEYVIHFGLEQYIHFNTNVLSMEPTVEKQWMLRIEDAAGIHDECFDYVFIANGHHWDPFLPDYPGVFSGETLHAHQYKKAAPFQGKKVLIVGGGNSACDLAVEISRVSPHTSISMRRGYHIFPKFVFGKATDDAVAKTRWMPRFLRQKLFSIVARGLQGRYAKYQLMKPDYGPLEAHPTINSELLYFIRHGKIKPRKGIERFDGKQVHFVDGLVEEYDTVIFATGYNISFPFLDKKYMDLTGALQVPLYRKMMHPEFESLYFIGLCQPQGCIWPLADLQAKIAARIIQGTLRRPENIIEKISNELKKPHYHFTSNMRHALEVDYHRFRQELQSMLQ